MKDLWFLSGLLSHLQNSKPVFRTVAVGGHAGDVIHDRLEVEVPFAQRNDGGFRSLCLPHSDDSIPACPTADMLLRLTCRGVHGFGR